MSEHFTMPMALVDKQLIDRDRPSLLITGRRS